MVSTNAAYLSSSENRICGSEWSFQFSASFSLFAAAGNFLYVISDIAIIACSLRRFRWPDNLAADCKFGKFYFRNPQLCYDLSPGLGVRFSIMRRYR